MISSLNDARWRDRFDGARRVDLSRASPQS
jgi:hypothetical protein